jgi:hypothetical protein
MTIRTQLKVGKLSANQSERFLVRSTLKAGGTRSNHHQAVRRVRSTIRTARVTSHDDTETLRVRSKVKAGGMNMQHNEALRRASLR